MKKIPPLLPMTLINRFEKSCNIFGGTRGNPLLSITLGQFAQKKKKENLYLF
jgi:hypothetical protein